MRTVGGFALLLCVMACAAEDAHTGAIDTSGCAMADHVRIIGNEITRTDKDTREISDSEQIGALCRFVSSQPATWQKIRFDAPVLRWSVEFSRAGKTLGSFGIGANFIEMYPYILTLQPVQQRQIVELLHVAATPLRY